MIHPLADFANLLDEPSWRPRAESQNKFRIFEGDAHAFQISGLCSIHRRLWLVGDPRPSCRAGLSSSPRHRSVRARTNEPHALTGFLPWHRQRSQLHTAGKTLQPPTFHVLPGIEVRVSRRIDEGRLSVHVWNSIGKRLDKLISGEAERQQT